MPPPSPPSVVESYLVRNVLVQRLRLYARLQPPSTTAVHTGWTGQRVNSILYEASIERITSCSHAMLKLVFITVHLKFSPTSKFYVRGKW